MVRLLTLSTLLIALTGLFSSLFAKDFEAMSNLQLLGYVQDNGFNESTIGGGIELLERLDSREDLPVSLSNFQANLCFELSRYYYNQFTQSLSSADLSTCVDYGDRLREEFPTFQKSVLSLQFKIDGYRALNEWPAALAALDEGMRGIAEQRFSKSREAEWLAAICSIYAIIEDWEAGEPFFIKQYQSLQSSAKNKALSAIYLIKTYEFLEKPLQALPYIKDLELVGNERWDPELNLSLFKLGNQFSDESIYSTANYLYFNCLSLEDSIRFYQEQFRALENRKQWFLYREIPVPEAIEEEMQSVESYLESLKEQPSFTAPLKYAKARNLKRMGRDYDSFFSYLRLVREHPRHNFSERYHYIAFDLSLKIGLNQHAIDLGEAYLERPDYSEYWHSVMAQLIGAYFKADAYEDVVHRGTEFMQQSPEHAYSTHIVHYMAYSWVRMERPQLLRKRLQDYIENYPEAPFLESAHYWIGLSHVLDQDFNVAIPHFDAVIKNFPEGSFFTEAKFRRAVCDFGNGDYDSAQVKFIQWVNGNPKHALRAEAENLLGDISAYKAEVQTALRHYLTVPEYTDQIQAINHAYFESARLLEANASYSKMISVLNEYIERFPNVGDLGRALLRISEAYEQQNRPIDMLNAYREAIQTYGDNPASDGIDTMFFRYAEKYEYYLSEYRDSIAFLNRILEDESFRLDLMSDRKRVHLYKLQHPSVNASLMERLIRDSQLRNGLYQRAIPQSEEAQAQGLAVEWDRGILPEARDFIQSELENFEQFMERFPQEAPLEMFTRWQAEAKEKAERTMELRCSIALESIGGIEQAGLDLALVDLSVASPAILAWIGNKQLASEPALAKAAAQRILNDFPESMVVPEAYYLLAELSEIEGDYASAIAGYDAISERFPLWGSVPNAVLRSADICLENDQVEEALNRYLHILKVRDWRGIAWAEACFKIGRCFEQSNEPMKAHGFFERTYLGYPQFAEWKNKAILADASLLERVGESLAAQSLRESYSELFHPHSSAEAMP